jgi:hypothetical protein
MKYKVGDKVRIKIWEDMLIELCNYWETLEQARNRLEDQHICLEKELNKVNVDRILTIESIEKREGYYCYRTKEKGWEWTEDMIEGIVEDVIEDRIEDRIESRFEILDI